ncbi:unnamed protein product [Amoebophrya sp. A120]|nr:unnamed protein product [Amoebophrya sp. A120]|eukprot:GSA120T00014172001.1
MKTRPNKPIQLVLQLPAQLLLHSTTSGRLLVLPTFAAAAEGNEPASVLDTPLGGRDHHAVGDNFFFGNGTAISMLQQLYSAVKTTAVSFGRNLPEGHDSSHEPARESPSPTYEFKEDYRPRLRGSKRKKQMPTDEELSRGSILDQVQPPAETNSRGATEGSVDEHQHKSSALEKGNKGDSSAGAAQEKQGEHQPDSSVLQEKEQQPVGEQPVTKPEEKPAGEETGREKPADMGKTYDKPKKDSLTENTGTKEKQDAAGTVSGAEQKEGAEKEQPVFSALQKKEKPCEGSAQKGCRKTAQDEEEHEFAAARKDEHRSATNTHDKPDGGNFHGDGEEGAAVAGAERKETGGVENVGDYLHGGSAGAWGEGSGEKLASGFVENGNGVDAGSLDPLAWLKNKPETKWEFRRKAGLHALLPDPQVGASQDTDDGAQTREEIIYAERSKLRRQAHASSIKPLADIRSLEASAVKVEEQFKKKKKLLRGERTKERAVYWFLKYLAIEARQRELGAASVGDDTSSEDGELPVVRGVTPLTTVEQLQRVVKAMLDICDTEILVKKGANGKWQSSMLGTVAVVALGHQNILNYFKHTFDAGLAPGQILNGASGLQDYLLQHGRQDQEERRRQKAESLTAKEQEGMTGFMVYETATAVIARLRTGQDSDSGDENFLEPRHLNHPNMTREEKHQYQQATPPQSD